MGWGGCCCEPDEVLLFSPDGAVRHATHGVVIVLLTRVAAIRLLAGPRLADGGRVGCIDPPRHCECEPCGYPATCQPSMHGCHAAG